MIRIPFKIKTLLIPLVVLLLCISVFKIVSLVSAFKVESNWDKIRNDKYSEIKYLAEQLFWEYRNNLSNFVSKLTENKKLISYINSQNIKKSYENLSYQEDFSKYNIEIYNQRLELILFSGRQIHPEIISLQNSFSGKSFERIERSGTVSYLVKYTPIKAENPETQNNYIAVLVVSSVLDVQNLVNEELYSETGISNEFKKRYGVKINYFFENRDIIDANVTAVNNSDYLNYNLIENDADIYSRIEIPVLNIRSYQLEITEHYNFLISLLTFTVSVICLIIIFFYIRKVKSGFFKVCLTIFTLIAYRYLYLGIEFPSKLFDKLNINIFSPVYFASEFGFGIAKSLGELLLTLIFILLIIYFIFNYNINLFKSSNEKKSIIHVYVFIVLSVPAILICNNILFYVISTLVNNSNISFFKRSWIYNLDELEFIVSIIVVVSFVMIFILINSLIALRAINFITHYTKLHNFIKHNFIVFFFSFLLILNLLLVIYKINIPHSTPSLLNSSLLILFSGFFAFIIYRILKQNEYSKILTIPILSFITLLSVVVSPLLLISNITSQENKYLEQETKRLAVLSGEEIPFIINTVLDDLTGKEFIRNIWKDNYIKPKLAYYLWSSSRLYTENLNSIVILLNEQKQVISDFSMNPLEFNADSIINFVNRKKAFNLDNEEDTLSFIEGENEDGTEEVEGVFRNSDYKYYAGVKPVYQQPGDNPEFKELLGYILIAVQYETRNYFSVRHFEFFKGYKPDRIANKLTSRPIYSEFSDGELVGTSNNDISKSLIKSLDALRSSLEGKIDKSALRYDQIENSLYKTYYVIVEPAKNQPEKIYSVSLKVNDINSYAFFFFKCLLVSLVVYLLIVFLYTFIIALKTYFSTGRILLYPFGFREKLFVSFCLVSVIPVIILALYSREYVENKNNQAAVNEIISDLKLIEQYILSKLDRSDVRIERKATHDNTILKTKIFGKEFAASNKIFNLFVKNKLVSTTNEELYKSDLLDTRISGNAYYNVVLLKRDFFTENQEIGSYKFVSGYKTIYYNNNLLGIVSTLTLFRQYEIDSEVIESLVYIFGTYLITIIFLIVIVNFLSSRISNPIIKLMQATEDLSKGKTEINIPVTTKDEIGELVKSFNKMIVELKRSREELKKAERESAWRDIARQVAHEIKNPLTPMKLAMQHLYYAYTHSSKDFKSIIQSTNKLITDQIETLNRIATEFSDFAKMPGKNYVPVNMNEIIKDTVKLLESQCDIQLNFEDSGLKTLILGDRDELKRIIINIVRNSIQAIEQNTDNEKKGKIIITTYTLNNRFEVKIQDNGIGMDEQTQQKLFEPYFSTKSSGMGLGLVITKKILDEMGAKILINSVLHEGTEVIISFPVLLNPN